MVVAQILDLADAELEVTPENSSIQGSLVQQPGIKWRRCVPVHQRADFESFDTADDDDDFRVVPHDFVIMYRQLLPNEAIDNHLAEDLIVLRVLSNPQLVALIASRRQPTSA